MKEHDIPTTGEWLCGEGPENDIVISSRIRLARNIAGFSFLHGASVEERKRINDLLREKIHKAGIADDPIYYDLESANAIERAYLVERHLISRELAEAQGPRSVAVARDESLSMMINEEDHLRLQFLRGGLRLEEVYEQADQFDDVLSGAVRYAFSPKYGHLTACPTNTGTGLRASVMLHLPGVVMAQEMDRVIKIARGSKLAIRGVYGEGTHGAGDFYQVSNHVTLGLAEDEIINGVTEAATRLVALERTARLNLYNQHRKEFEKRIRHAFGLLCVASTISSQEALNLLSQVRMGVEMNLLAGTRIEALNDLFLLTLPAHLQTIRGEVLDSSVTDEVRASYVKSVLTSG
ncbi:MAG: protein arginine kinase [Candidatus Brocadiae bacterium]|nr:protein arginine kinase [Candidatus Brocadiia bacterium]